MAAQKNTGPVVMQTVIAALDRAPVKRGMEARKAEELAQRRTDLHHEGDETEGIVMHHDPPNIADDLVNTADNHTCQESPGPPPDAEDYVDDHGHGEEADESDVGTEGRLVLVDTPVQRTDIQGAVPIWPKRDNVLIIHIRGPWKISVGSRHYDEWHVGEVKRGSSVRRAEFAMRRECSREHFGKGRATAVRSGRVWYQDVFVVAFLPLCQNCWEPVSTTFSTTSRSCLYTHHDDPLDHILCQALRSLEDRPTLRRTRALASFVSADDDGTNDSNDMLMSTQDGATNPSDPRAESCEGL